MPCLGFCRFCDFGNPKSTTARHWAAAKLNWGGLAQVGFMFKGGKMDDITVVVSYITAVDADAGVKSKL